MADKNGAPSKQENSDSKSAPAGAGAAAAAVTLVIDDGEIARRFATVEQLTVVYGFDMEVATQAVDAVGTDVATCCDFILEQGLGQDTGGPVTPIDSCPHLQAHVKLTPDDLPQQPHLLPCTHFQDATAAAIAAGGDQVTKPARAKAEVEQDGTCPLGENWLCLECGKVRCSRYINAHGVAHWEETRNGEGSSKDGHCVAVSLADLSVWCHVCRAYLRHPTALDPLVKRLEELKFADDDEKA